MMTAKLGLLALVAVTATGQDFDTLFSVNYFGLLATIILAGSGATWTGVESVVMA